MEDKVLLDVQGLRTYFHTFQGRGKSKIDNVKLQLKRR